MKITNAARVTLISLGLLAGCESNQDRSAGSNPDGSQSLILDQVTNGVAVRMAVLYLLAGGNFEKEDETPPVKKQKRERKAPQQ